MNQKHIIFMGTPAIAAKVLQALIDSDVSVDLVVTQPDKQVGRKKKIVFSEVKALAQEHQIPVFQPAHIKKDHQAILDHPCDLIVTCAYGQIVPQTVLDHPKSGCVNLHASLLPEYRGGAPIQRAIMDGKKESGMTLMQMVQKMDAGPIFAQKKVEILPTDNASSLFEKMGDAASSLLKENLEELCLGKVHFQEQKESEATYAPIILAEEEKIDLAQSDEQIVNQIRALSDEPGAYVLVDGKKLKITQALYVPKENVEAGRFSQTNKKELNLELHHGYLSLKQVQMEGKPSMPIQNFINGQGRALLGKTAE
ncbi:methionyl-tRNA formyltransferase [Dubosiella newyorkensis]|jgi:methionyl-tRNA formyltransferase|uniref:methionyl-tRNA formyltransferase n=4 Tax=Dubosiella newyorkensis TaxID=1862672 RepID=UPI0023577469|nr:methionyl-tRNA formyltransferase [Dubosiella newyorkensis]MCI9040657.1 methionyl-tRNA formyltransferase [Dubosiella newyorkensis]